MLEREAYSIWLQIAVLGVVSFVFTFALFRLFRKPHPNRVQPFRLLDLPRELRDQIYEHALQNERRDVWFFNRPRAWCILRRNPIPSVTLFQVSKQVRRESVPVYWSSCHLDFVVKYSERQAFVNSVRDLDQSVRYYLLRNPDIYIRVIFDKACSEHREYKMSELPGQIASTVGCMLKIKEKLPVRNWILISEHPDVVDSSGFVKTEEWVDRPIVILVHPDLVLRMMCLLDRMGAETAEALGFEAVSLEA